MLFFQRDGLHKKISGGLECDVECGLTFSLKNIFKPYGIRSPTMLTLTPKPSQINDFPHFCKTNMAWREHKSVQQACFTLIYTTQQWCRMVILKAPELVTLFCCLKRETCLVDVRVSKIWWNSKLLFRSNWFRALGYGHVGDGCVLWLKAIFWSFHNIIWMTMTYKQLDSKFKNTTFLTSCFLLWKKRCSDTISSFLI